MALAVKNPPANAGGIRDASRSLDRDDPLEEGMATHSSILAWRIPWTEEPGGLQSTGHRVRHDWARMHRHLEPWCVGVNVRGHRFKDAQEALFVCLRSCSELWSPLSLGIVYWGVTYIYENVLIKCTVGWILANAFSHVITVDATNRENSFITSQISCCPLQQRLFPLPRPWSHWPDLCPLVYFL